MRLLKWICATFSRRPRWVAKSEGAPSNGNLTEQLTRVLAYALPHRDNGWAVRSAVLENFELDDLRLGHQSSFLDYDIVVVFAGSFEKIERDAPVRYAKHDLDRRERELHTLLTMGKAMVFIVGSIPDSRMNYQVDSGIDLYRRVTAGLGLDWLSVSGKPVPCLCSNIPEFREYVQTYGSASVAFLPSPTIRDRIDLVAGDEKACFGLAIDANLFFLPSYDPMGYDRARVIVIDAVRAVMKYRRRVSKEMPSWAHEFRFTAEQLIRQRIDEHRARLNELDASKCTYDRWKGALIYKSDPLVEVVADLLRSVFGIRIQLDDKKIEDAKVVDQAGNTLAVIEIKGDVRSFKRADVGQVDSHRERLGLSSTTPGILIMNTMMKAACLAEKDELPHRDIIAKAVSDNVLLLRTLDLLRYADLIEQGKRSTSDFSTDILGNTGWLKVANGAVAIVRE